MAETAPGRICGAFYRKRSTDFHFRTQYYPADGNLARVIHVQLFRGVLDAISCKRPENGGLVHNGVPRARGGRRRPRIRSHNA